MMQEQFILLMFNINRDFLISLEMVVIHYKVHHGCIGRILAPDLQEGRRELNKHKEENENEAK
jgi:hypothetical protein